MTRAERVTGSGPAADPAALGFAIVGSGAIAGVIASALATVEGSELRLVVGRRPDAARLLATEHGARWTDDLGGWLRSPAADSVDVVVVATPSGTHADLVVPALEAGKHVLVEKPIDVDLGAADRIIDAERRTGNVVAVVSQHRFDPSTEALLEAVRSGRLGRLTSAVASCAWWRPESYYRSAAWRGTTQLDGGGAVINQGIHVVDLLLAVMGDPVEVFARVGTLAHDGLEVEDVAVATVVFASGALGVVHATTAAFPGVESSLRVHGDHGSAAIVDDELVYLRTATDQSQDGDAAGRPAGPSALDVRSRPGGGGELKPAQATLGRAHADQLRDLVSVVRARQAGELRPRPRVGTREARGALALVLAMYESALSGRPVRL